MRDYEIANETMRANIQDAFTDYDAAADTKTFTVRSTVGRWYGWRLELEPIAEWPDVRTIRIIRPGWRGRLYEARSRVRRWVRWAF